jgi:hypothetical protein
VRPPGAQHPVDLRERAVRILDVLDHLHRQDRVEAAVLDRQRGRVCFVEGDVRALLGTTCRDREHLRAAVHADHRPRVADLLEQLRDVEAGTAADVENPLARRGGQSLPGQSAAPQDVARPVGDLELLREIVVEDDLTHRSRDSHAA